MTDEKKPAFALTKAGSDEIIAWACGKCGIVAGSVRTHGDHAQEVAEKHCGPRACKDCGGLHDREYQELCPPCWLAHNRKWRDEKEQVAFDKATKVLDGNYDGPVYWDESNHNEGFFRDTDELSVWCEDQGLDMPDYVWACDVRHPSLDFDSLCEQALEDTCDGCELEALGELRAAIDSWNAKQSEEIWDVDYSRAVLLTSEATASLPAASTAPAPTCETCRHREGFMCQVYGPEAMRPSLSGGLMMVNLDFTCAKHDPRDPAAVKP